MGRQQVWVCVGVYMMAILVLLLVFLGKHYSIQDANSFNGLDSLMLVGEVLLLPFLHNPPKFVYDTMD